MRPLSSSSSLFFFFYSCNFLVILFCRGYGADVLACRLVEEQSNNSISHSELSCGQRRVVGGRVAPVQHIAEGDMPRRPLTAALVAL